jgi:hypothetical protein
MWSLPTPGVEWLVCGGSAPSTVAVTRLVTRPSERPSSSMPRFNAFDTCRLRRDVANVAYAPMESSQRRQRSAAVARSLDQHNQSWCCHTTRCGPHCVHKLGAW